MSGLGIETTIIELTVGEALLNLLDAKGRPSLAEPVYILPPGSQIGLIGLIGAEQRRALLQKSTVTGMCEKTVALEPENYRAAPKLARRFA